MADYRNTRYCPEFDNIAQRKDELKTVIEARHHVKDLYTMVSPNDGVTYKKQFMEIYNCKCCYCGVSIPIISKELFEIDHFRNKKHEVFESEAAAGIMENLVLACRKCNRSKLGFSIDDDDYGKLYPDDGSIATVFIRDENYYIKVAPEKQADGKVQAFYTQLKLNEEVRRLDFLLMNIQGLMEKMSDNPEVCRLLEKAYLKLLDKRAMM